MKKKFNILITRDITESTYVDVEADTEEQAKDLAMDEIIAKPFDFTWVPDEGGYQGDPFVSGCKEVKAKARS